MNRLRFRIVSLALLALASCSAPYPSKTYNDQLNEFADSVAKKKMGRDIDHWIELKNLAGEWEKVGLVFGFIGDYDECLKAVEGLKKANYAREYRCTPAQSSSAP